MLQSQLSRRRVFDYVDITPCGRSREISAQQAEPPACSKAGSFEPFSPDSGSGGGNGKLDAVITPSFLRSNAVLRYFPNTYLLGGGLTPMPRAGLVQQRVQIVASHDLTLVVSMQPVWVAIEDDQFSRL